MVEGTAAEIKNWEHLVVHAGGSAEFDMEARLHEVTGRVLSLTAFGGDFEKGEDVFKLQTVLAKEVFEMISDVKFMLSALYRCVH